MQTHEVHNIEVTSCKYFGSRLIESGNHVDDIGEDYDSCVEPSGRHAEYINKSCRYYGSLTEAPYILSEDICDVVEIHDDCTAKSHVDHVADTIEDHGSDMVEHHFHVVVAHMINHMMKKHMQVVAHCE